MFRSTPPVFKELPVPSPAALPDSAPSPSATQIPPSRFKRSPKNVREQVVAVMVEDKENDPFEFDSEEENDGAFLIYDGSVGRTPVTLAKPLQEWQNRGLGGQTPTPSRPPCAAGILGRTPRPTPTNTRFKQDRESLGAALFAEFNESIFEGRLPPDMHIAW
ncbi:hypothetical protein BDK51DRAFT_30076 [Blyttiomyces helicus]|uniref:Uncharacterized protein n=1 Tax=Blyttiomyces helicus TaxID=388810 RepID=A0A4P9WHL9_9FUNG|nr:hypothetical protein BDK51DRAFT_30076 [Blyttiomyces helicus]|eukprot:RKO90036.1 hypothetical protein BDK51DRAFT_30076 [Blyttiomyces helicus]